MTFHLLINKIESLSTKNFGGFGDFEMLTMCFVLFCYYIPLEMGMAHHLNITTGKSLLPKAASCQVCLKMTDENGKSLQTDERQTDDT